MVGAHCPKCGDKIDIESVENGDTLDCFKCNAVLTAMKRGKKIILRSEVDGVTDEFEEEAHSSYEPFPDY